MGHFIRRWLAVAMLALAPLGAARAQTIDSTTSALQLLIMGSGLHQNDWGAQTSTNIQKIESAIIGVQQISTTGGTTTLTDDQARPRILKIVGALTSNATIVVPARVKDWRILNATTGGFTVTLQPSGGTGAVIPASPSYLHVLTDGSAVFLPGFMVGSNNLSDVASAATARTNLGLGDVATHPASDFAVASTTTTANNAMPKAGGTFTGTVNMGSQTLTGLATPTNATDAAPKSYVDGARLAQASVSGLLITNNATTPNTKIDVTANSALLVNSSGAPVFTNSAYTTACTINLSTTGDKGMDTGSMPATGWVHVYLQGNGSTFSCIASTSATAPILTSGYTYSMRVGAMYVSSSALRASIQRGAVAQYIATTNSTSAIPTIAAGAGSGSFSLAALVPPTATAVSVSLGNPGSITSDNSDAWVGPSLNHSAYFLRVSYRQYGGNNITQGSFVLETQNVYYSANDSRFSAWCNGWTDAVSAN